MLLCFVVDCTNIFLFFLEYILTEGKNIKVLELKMNGFHFIYQYLRKLLEKAMAPYSSALAWKIPWMEEPCRLQSIGLLRIGHG